MMPRPAGHRPLKRCQPCREKGRPLPQQRAPCEKAESVYRLVGHEGARNDTGKGKGSQSAIADSAASDAGEAP